MFSIKTIVTEQDTQVLKLEDLLEALMHLTRMVS